MKPVLVLDAETDQALAVVRSLSAKGIPVHAAGRGKWAPALWSFRPEKRFLYPSPLSSPRDFFEWICKVLEPGRYQAVFPMTDSTLTVLQKFRARLPSALFAMAAGEAYRKVSDKFFSQELARKQGLSVPETLHPQSLEELQKTGGRLKFPVVLKPRFSRFYEDRDQTLKTGDTQIIFERRKLERTFLESRQGDSFPCIQEWVEGTGFGVEILLQKGEVLALFCHRRLREMNPLGSGSSVCESVAPRNDLVEPSIAMLKSCGYEGVAMVEFRTDEKTGKAWFVEINGRFWGSLALPLACGVPFPFLYLQTLQGEKVSPVSVYPAGVRARSLWKESSRLLSALKGKPEGWNGPFPSFGEAMRDFFGSFFKRKQICFDFQWKDPLPALVANGSFWLKTFFRLFRHG